MTGVHCTNCGVEGQFKRKGGCLYKLAFLFSVICVAMILVPGFFLNTPSGQNLTEEENAMVGLSQVMGMIGGVIGLFLIWLTSTRCCRACSATTVVPLRTWKKMHPEGNGGTTEKRRMKKCPECAEEVLEEAKKCRFCGAEFN